ncbi:MAG: hypothetical protein R3B45_08510 [Bdellovibrionota bacterium]
MSYFYPTFKKSLYFLLGIFLSVSMHACNKKEESKNSDDEITPTNTTVPVSNPGSLAVGGLPSEEEYEGALELNSDETNIAVSDVHEATTEMPLGLAIDAAATSLTAEEECSNGLFCITEAFSKIFDMVTGAAKCNFDLLLGQYTEGEVPFKKVSDKSIYYLDGFGVVGIGENGVSQCPSIEEVDNWAKQHHLKDGEPTQEVSENTFFLPTRLVVFRHRSGSIYWKIVFFPNDFIDKLAKRITYFSRLLDQDLDFLAFNGDQEFGADVGMGKGNITIDWDEISRMSSLLQEDSSSESGNLPSGKILINYDMASSPQSYTTTFLDGFSFGDSDDSPFSVGMPTTVYKSDSENYIHFVSNQAFGRPDPSNPDDDGGPMGVVQFCLDDSWKQENGGGPFGADVKYVSVPESSYLSYPAVNHLQMIWKEGATAGEPENYTVAMTATKGGAYIYGDVEFRAGSVPNNSQTIIRVKAPKCTTMTQAMIDELEQAMATDGGQPGFTFFDNEGFRNMLFDGPLGPNAGSPTFVSKADAEALFPQFSTFHLITIGTDELPY